MEPLKKYEMSDQKLMTSREAAKHLRVHRNTLLGLRRSGEVPSITLGKRKYLFDLDQVKKALTKKQGK